VAPCVRAILHGGRLQVPFLLFDYRSYASSHHVFVPYTAYHHAYHRDTMRTTACCVLRTAYCVLCAAYCVLRAACCMLRGGAPACATRVNAPQRQRDAEVRERHRAPPGPQLRAGASSSLLARCPSSSDLLYYKYALLSQPAAQAPFLLPPSSCRSLAFPLLLLCDYPPALLTHRALHCTAHAHRPPWTGRAPTWRRQRRWPPPAAAPARSGP
jgi:hypothetical protein